MTDQPILTHAAVRAISLPAARDFTDRLRQAVADRHGRECHRIRTLAVGGMFTLLCDAERELMQSRSVRERRQLERQIAEYRQQIRAGLVELGVSVSLMRRSAP